MFKMLCALAVCFCLSACSVAVQQPDQSAVQLQKAREDARILESVLARCREQLPEPSEWPRVYTTGYYGDFWMKAPVNGRVLEMKRTPSPAEEQLIIVSRTSKDEPVLAEGKGIRQVDAGVYAIFLYSLPQTPEERKKTQTVVITYGNTRFVLLFKPARF